MNQRVPTTTIEIPRPRPQASAIMQWRTRTLNTILYVSLVIGLIAIVGSSFDMFAESPNIAAVLLAIYTTIYILTWVMAFVHRLPFALRAGFLLTITYVLTMIEFTNYGLSGNGFTFLFTLVTLSTIFFGGIGGVSAIAWSMASYTVCSWLLLSGRIIIPVTTLANSTRASAWLSGALVFVLTASTATLATAYLLNNLKETLSIVADEAQRADERAHDAVQHAEQLAQQTTRLEATEQTLRSLVDTLEVAAVPLADGVLLAPLAGALDEQRLAKMSTRLLQTASTQRTQLMIIDLAGTTNVDTQVAGALLQTVQALRLLGCDVALTGIAPTMALTMTHLGLDFQHVTIAQSPQQLLAARAQRA